MRPLLVRLFITNTITFLKLFFGRYRMLQSRNNVSLNKHEQDGNYVQVPRAV
jgi:hypothetical protein